MDVGSRAAAIQGQRFERFPGVVGVGKRPGRLVVIAVQYRNNMGSEWLLEHLLCGLYNLFQFSF